MKVLITGGYGFIGRFVAQRFAKEGYNVVIIDNLSNTLHTKPTFVHKFYKLDVSDINCKNVFKANKFDIVIHIAGFPFEQKSGLKSYTSKNIDGLNNVVNLSIKFGVKKLIYISDYRVYAKTENISNNENITKTENCLVDPLQPEIIEKYMGELVVSSASQVYGLETASVRLSNVYGPFQWNSSYKNIVVNYSQLAFENKEIDLYGDWKQYFESIYVEDVADAIYRLAISQVSGVINLSSGYKYTIKDFIEILTKISNPSSLNYKKNPKLAAENILLDTTKAKTKLDWVAMNNLEDGLTKTFDTYKNSSKNSPDLSSNNKKYNDNISYYIPYIENIFLLAIVFLITKYNFTLGTSFGIDYRIIYILIMGSLYGTTQSLIAAFGSIFLYTIDYFYLEKDFISFFYDGSSLICISFYILIGLLVGYSTENSRRKIKSKDSEIIQLKEKYSLLGQIFSDTDKIKEELKEQISNHDNSMGKIYSYAKYLQSLNSDEILYSSIALIQNEMKTDSVGLYLLSSDQKYLRLFSKSSNSNAKNSICLEQFPEIKNIISTKEIFTNKSLNPKLPLFASPIIHSNKVIGIIIIENMQFEHISLRYLNLLKIIIDFISLALWRAYFYEASISDKRMIKGTGIFSNDYFEKILRIRNKAKQKNYGDFTLLKINTDKNEFLKRNKLAHSKIRVTDCFGVDKNGNIFLLLQNSSYKVSSSVIKRLNNIGIKASIQKGA